MTISKKCTCFVNDSCTSGDSKATGVAHLTCEEFYDVKRLEPGSVAACTSCNAPPEADVVRPLCDKIGNETMFDEHVERVVQEELETDTDRELGPLLAGSSCWCSRQQGEWWCRIWAGEDFDHFAENFTCEYGRMLGRFFHIPDITMPVFELVNRVSGQLEAQGESREHSMRDESEGVDQWSHHRSELQDDDPGVLPEESSSETGHEV